MRNYLSLFGILAMLFLLPLSVVAAPIAVYNFENANVDDASASASLVSQNLTASDFTFLGDNNPRVRGDASNKYFWANTISYPSEYYFFSLAATELTVDSISFDVTHNDGYSYWNPALAVAVDYSTDINFGSYTELDNFMVPKISGFGWANFTADATPLIDGQAGTYYFRITAAPQVWTAQVLVDNITVEGSAVPEPTTMLLLGTGLIGLAGIRRRKK